MNIPHPVSFLDTCRRSYFKKHLSFLPSEVVLVLQRIYLVCLCHLGNYIAVMHFTWNYLLRQIGTKARPGLSLPHTIFCPVSVLPLCTRMGYFQKEMEVVRGFNDPGQPILDIFSSLYMVCHPAEKVNWRCFGV